MYGCQCNSTMPVDINECSTEFTRKNVACTTRCTELRQQVHICNSLSSMASAFVLWLPLVSIRLALTLDLSIQVTVAETGMICAGRHRRNRHTAGRRFGVHGSARP